MKATEQLSYGDVYYTVQHGQFLGVVDVVITNWCKTEDSKHNEQYPHHNAIANKQDLCNTHNSNFWVCVDQNNAIVWLSIQMKGIE